MKHFQEKKKLGSDICCQQEQSYLEAGKSKTERAILESKCSDLKEKLEVIEAENSTLEKEVKEVKKDKEQSLADQLTKFEVQLRIKSQIFEQKTQYLRNRVQELEKALKESKLRESDSETSIESHEEVIKNITLASNQLKEQLISEKIQIQNLKQVTWKLAATLQF